MKKKFPSIGLHVSFLASINLLMMPKTFDEHAYVQAMLSIKAAR